MRLKTYLRGLGIGMLITALIIGISSTRNTPVLSDEEIKTRAYELGMVDSESNQNVLDEKMQQEEALSEENSTEETEILEIEPDNPEVDNTETMEPETNVEIDTPQSVQEENVETEIEESEVIKTEQKITFSVNAGESSYTVAKKLENLGGVESAIDFDQYLCDRGYATKIRVGSYEITSKMTYEEIASVISGGN